MKTRGRSGRARRHSARQSPARRGVSRASRRVPRGVARASHSAVVRTAVGARPARLRAGSRAGRPRTALRHRRAVRSVRPLRTARRARGPRSPSRIGRGVCAALDSRARAPRGARHSAQPRRARPHSRRARLRTGRSVRSPRRRSLAPRSRRRAAVRAAQSRARPRPRRAPVAESRELRPIHLSESVCLFFRHGTNDDRSIEERPLFWCRKSAETR